MKTSVHRKKRRGSRKLPATMQGKCWKHNSVMPEKCQRGNTNMQVFHIAKKRRTSSNISERICIQINEEKILLLTSENTKYWSRFSSASVLVLDIPTFCIFLKQN